MLKRSMSNNLLDNNCAYYKFINDTININIHDLNVFLGNNYITNNEEEKKYWN